MSDIWNFYPYNSQPPVGWCGVNFLLLLFSAVHDISWTFDPLKSPLRPPLVGGGKLSFYRFSRQFMKLTGLLKFWPPQPPPPWNSPPPRVGWVKTNCIDFLDSSWHFPDFWFFYPLKFPLRPPLVGGGGVKKFFIDFLDSSWNLPDFLNFNPQPPPPPGTPPGVGWVKTNLLIFWTVHDISRTFDFLTP